MSFSDELKSQLNIVDVVGTYVRLKRQGATMRYLGLCPFHSEKTPSFNVNAVLQYYKCFGCDAAGDVFKFVMTHDQLTFPEAIRSLAERYGIPIPERDSSDDPEVRRRRILLEMHEAATEIFQENLRSANGKDARAYLKERGVAPDAVREFRLGLSDVSGNQLANRLKHFGALMMKSSGLLGQRPESGEFYDRFRGRLMFPIHDESGKVIAFGGRAMRDGDEPKYLNSPETPLYRKSGVLYNLNRAKIQARKNDRIVLVEGYMDVIGVYSAGIQEVVASSGTALSHDQVRAIKRQFSQSATSRGSLVLNFDPDAAGARSTEKHIPTALAEGLRVRVLKIPGGLDPDEWIQQAGPDAYRTLLDRAESYFHWLAQRAREKFDLQTAEGRVDALKFLAPSIQFVRDSLERSATINELAEYLRLERETIRDYLRQPIASPMRKSAALMASIHPNEKLLIACLVSSQDARVAIRSYLEQTQFTSKMELREIFEAVIASNPIAEFSIEDLMQRLSERSQRLLSDLSFSDLGLRETDAAQQAIHCLEQLERSALESERNDLKRQIRDAEMAGDMEIAMALIAKLNGLGGTFKA